MVDYDPMGPYGDRRQEIVFIGQFESERAGAGTVQSQRALEEVLDTCLLTDAGVTVARIMCTCEHVSIYLC